MNNSNQFSAGETRRDSIYPFSEGATPPSEPSDEELVPRAQSGDKDALDKLVRRHQPWVFNIAIRIAPFLTSRLLEFFSPSFFLTTPD